MDTYNISMENKVSEMDHGDHFPKSMAVKLPIYLDQFLSQISLNMVSSVKCKVVMCQ